MQHSSLSIRLHPATVVNWGSGNISGCVVSAERLGKVLGQIFSEGSYRIAVEQVTNIAIAALDVPSNLRLCFHLFVLPRSSGCKPVVVCATKRLHYPSNCSCGSQCLAPVVPWSCSRSPLPDCLPVSVRFSSIGLSVCLWTQTQIDNIVRKFLNRQVRASASRSCYSMVHGRPSVQQAVKVAISPYSMSVCLSYHLQVDNVVVGMDVFC